MIERWVTDDRGGVILPPLLTKYDASLQLRYTLGFQGA